MHTTEVISRAAAAAPQPYKYCVSVFLLAVDTGFVCGSWIYMWILDQDPGSSAGRAAETSRPQSLVYWDARNLGKPLQNTTQHK